MRIIPRGAPHCRGVLWPGAWAVRARPPATAGEAFVPGLPGHEICGRDMRRLGIEAAMCCGCTKSSPSLNLPTFSEAI